jgi:Fe-S cluster assembly protein SufD
MIDQQEEKNIYLSDFARFERSAAGNGQSWLGRIRKAALARFAENGFPTPRDEEWRFTNVAPLAKLPFRSAGRYEKNTLTGKKLDQATLPVGRCSRLVFVNGHYAPELSALEKLPQGVTVSSLAAALAAHPQSALPHLTKYASYQQQAFTALNTAFLQDGAYVSVPRGKVVETPIYLVFVATSSGEGRVAHPRNLVIAEEQSQVRIVESYVGLEEEVYFTNAVTEVVAGEGAIVEHYKVQRESEEAFHVATLQIQQARNSNFTSHLFSLGGGLVRNEINAELGGEGCVCTLNGLYTAGGQQHIDNHTMIDHALPHCASHELYKGILDGKAHGVFNGKIYVRQDAQKTDAKQTNQTLLLSDNAVINTKPQLEIYADDVKCTHGATIGQLQDEAIFYLRSRGIGREQARSLLTFAFANDLIGRIAIEPLRAGLESLFLSRHQLPQDAGDREAS